MGVHFCHCEPSGSDPAVVRRLLRSFQSLAMTSDEKLYIILPAFVEIKNRKANLIFCPLLLVSAYSSSVLLSDCAAIWLLEQGGAAGQQSKHYYYL
jgi:hypothetical protein